jgi:Icc-related predicted phosphoesterase
MRIAFLSDLHLESRCIHKTISRLYIPKVDLILLPGDIGMLNNNIEIYKYNKFLNHINTNKIGNIPVVLIPGNHEYYGYSFSNMENPFNILKSLCEQNNIILLQNQKISLTKNSNLLGTTLWTQKYHKFENQGLLYKESFKFLRENNNSQNDIIVTHFLPYIPKYLFLDKFKSYKNFIGSDILTYLSYKAIFHGHNHYTYTLPNKVYSNPIGHPHENFKDNINFKMVEI